MPTSGNRLYLGAIQANSENSVEVYIENRGGRYYWGICTTENDKAYFDREAIPSNPKIGTYYVIELCRDSIHDRSKLWVDGNLKIDVYRANSGNAYRVYCGITGTNNYAVVYVDNVKVATAYIGPDGILNSVQYKPSSVWQQPISGCAALLTIF